MDEAKALIEKERKAKVAELEARVDCIHAILRIAIKAKLERIEGKATAMVLVAHALSSKSREDSFLKSIISDTTSSQYAKDKMLEIFTEASSEIARARKEALGE